MRILYITGQLRIFGGIERVLAQKLNSLAKISSVEVILCTYEQHDYPFIFKINKKIRHIDLGINYDVDYTKESLYSWRSLKKIPEHIKKTKALISDIKPDVIIIPNFGFEFNFLPFINHNIPIVREFHDSQFYRIKKLNWKSKLKLKVSQFFEKRYNAIVLLTESEKEFFVYKKNLHVIPNPLFEEPFNKAEERKNIVITAGRIDSVKGFDILIDIWASISKEDRNGWELHIYGGGKEDYKSSLLKKIEDNKLSDSIKLKGTYSPILEKFSEAKIFTCTSRTESFGMALIEAQSVGLPVVSMDCPCGPRNIVKEGDNGYLIKLGDNIKFKQRLLELMQNDELRELMSKNSILNTKKYETDFIISKWIALFEELIGNK